MTGRWNVTYDAFNRLATAVLTQTGNPDAPAYSYSYDQYGNRWKQHLTAGIGNEVNYTFDGNNHITTTGFGYDSAGNLTKDGSGCNPCWTYDYAGQLTAGNGASYLYDALGRRQQRTDAGGTVHSFVYDGNSSYTEFIPGFARQTGGFYTYANGTTYFNRTDNLGTPRLSTDYTGAVQRTEGRLMGPFGDNFTETMSNLDFTGFAGGDWDAENNGDHFGFREYAKTQGRWYTPDPAGLAAVDPADPQTWNRYAYVGNNPLSFIDPLGLWNEPTCKVDAQPGCGFFGGGGDSFAPGGPGGPGGGYCPPEYPYCGEYPWWGGIGWGGGGGGGGGGAPTMGGAPPSSGGSVGSPVANDFLGFNLFCSGHTINTGPFPNPSTQPSAWSCALYFLQWQLGNLGVFLAQTGIAGSIFVPLITVYGGTAAFGANVPFAVLPNAEVACLGIGPGAAFPATKSFNIGPLLLGKLSNAQSILSGPSLSVGLQPAAGRGSQYIVNFNGALGGPTVGNVGMSISFTISGCTASPF